jgi:sarcosine oxidase subunit beta
VNIEMSMLAEKVMANFKEETGFEALFDRVGYLFLITDEEDAVDFRRHFELQKKLGLKVQMLKPEEIRERFPIVRSDDVIFGTFCHDDGLGDPYEFLRGYEQGARRLGVEIVFDAEVMGISVNDDEIKAIRTGKGEIKSPVVINCAGPHAGKVGELAGVDVPVQPLRRQIVTTGELSFVDPSFPMVVDVKSGLYTHKESKGLLLGWADKNMQPSFDTSIDPEYTDTIIEKGLDRIPRLEEAEIANQWAGLYETTPDHHAIIGFDPHVKGLFHVTGFSGHGFMQAPAAGIVAAELLTDRAPSVDISALSPARFDKGALVEETNVI